MYVRNAVTAVVSVIALLSAVTPVLSFADEPDLKLKVASRPRLESALRLSPAVAMPRVRDAAGLNRDAVTSRAQRPARTGQEEQVIRRVPHVALRSEDTPSNGFGIGDGDLLESEPNDRIAQWVSLPVNLIGKISVDDDIDFFAFRVLAGQLITIEAFAARLTDSDLIPDLVLFDSDGQVLATSRGTAATDPVIRFTPGSNAVLIAGIGDVDGVGGTASDYLLNVVRGTDVDEIEINDVTAQVVQPAPVTVFGDVATRGDVDFYSVNLSEGQALIVDVDAEILGSRLDAVVSLQDPASGVEFWYSDQYDGDDPRFNLVVPFSGRFVIAVYSFNFDSSGFYRMNVSLVPAGEAPLIARIVRKGGKAFEVHGIRFGPRAVIEVNGEPRKSTVVDAGTIKGKARLKLGDVITVSLPPQDTRSNPLLVQ